MCVRLPARGKWIPPRAVAQRPIEYCTELRTRFPQWTRPNLGGQPGTLRAIEYSPRDAEASGIIVASTEKTPQNRGNMVLLHFGFNPARISLPRLNFASIPDAQRAACRAFQDADADEKKLPAMYDSIAAGHTQRLRGASGQPTPDLAPIIYPAGFADTSSFVALDRTHGVLKNKSYMCHMAIGIDAAGWALFVI